MIEDITTELDGNPEADGDAYKVMRIQRSCTVGSQAFGAYLIHNKDGNATISMSCRADLDQPTCLLRKLIKLAENRKCSERSSDSTGDEKRLERLLTSASKSQCFSLAGMYEFLTLAGTSCGGVGFVLQFIGLRTLHWAASVSQLGATLIMIIVRARLRRALLQEPCCDELLSGHELSDVAFVLSRGKGVFGGTAKAVRDTENMLPRDEANHEHKSKCQKIPNRDAKKIRKNGPEIKDNPGRITKAELSDRLMTSSWAGASLHSSSLRNSIIPALGTRTGATRAMATQTTLVLMR